MKKRNSQSRNNMFNGSLPVVIFVGLSGSGKGTQSKLLAQKFNFSRLETGQLWRNAAAKRKDTLGQIGRKILAEGRLAPSDLTQQLVADKLKELKSKPIVIDGSPRQVVEVLVLEKNLRAVGRHISIVLEVRIAGREAVKRLLARGRADDHPLQIKRRVEWSKKKISKVIKYCRHQHKFPVVTINGQQSVIKVHKDIVKVLKKHKIVSSG